MLGMNFIGLSYLLVYVGAVSILFLFILMLINIRRSEISNETSNSIALAIIIGLLYNNPVYNIIPYNITTINIINYDFTSYNDYLNDSFNYIVNNNTLGFVTTHN